MKCPRCGDNELEPRSKDNLIIDVCTVCRGVWLDKGEMEKLLASAKEDYAAAPPPYDEAPSAVDPRRHDGHRRDRDHDWDDDDDDDRRRYAGGFGAPGGAYDGRGQPHRKRRWFESLGEIFD